MTKQIVLKLLREHTEEFLSGEAISRQAGVSRAAVWKAVEQLRQEGYGIESVPNRGYRLTRVTARLRPEELVGAVPGLVGSVGSCCALTPSTPLTTN